MATITTITPVTKTQDLFDALLPPYGTLRINIPIWDEERKMFIHDERESLAGNRSYSGIRVSDNLIIVEHIGNYHNFCYINNVEIYSHDGTSMKLISKHDFPKTFYDSALIRETTENMLKGFYRTQFAMLGKPLDEDALKQRVTNLIDASYCSMLNEDSKKMLQMANGILDKENY